eukprot:Pgem_evm1s16936
MFFKSPKTKKVQLTKNIPSVKIRTNANHKKKIEKEQKFKPRDLEKSTSSHSICDNDCRLEMAIDRLINISTERLEGQVPIVDSEDY